jgi:hypothetical protein
MVGAFVLTIKFIVVMPVTLIVDEITLAPENPAHRQVQSLHGAIPGRASRVDWCHSQEQAVTYLENRLFAYFIKREGLPVPLIIAQTDTGEKFLKARTDPDRPDTLLNLPLFTRRIPQPLRA